MVNIGLESGSERIRREILKRNYSNADVIRVVNLARGYGLKITFFNLIGIPTETIADFKETVRINRTCRPDRKFNFIFYPFPGTDLHHFCQEKGLLKKTLDDRQATRLAVLDLPGFPRKEIQKAFDYFEYYISSGYELEDIGMIDFLHKLHELLIRVPFYYSVLRPIIRHIKSKWLNHEV
jgi:radical SAM superfamily enzyme YgiQ (UPF0313 family)